MARPEAMPTGMAQAQMWLLLVMALMRIEMRAAVMTPFELYLWI
jgi:hypothetical protein